MKDWTTRSICQQSWYRALSSSEWKTERLGPYASSPGTGLCPVLHWVRHVTTRPSTSSTSSSSAAAAAAAADLTDLVFVKLSVSLSVYVLRLKHSYQHKQNSHYLTSPNTDSNWASKILSTNNITNMLATGYLGSN